MLTMKLAGICEVNAEYYLNWCHILFLNVLVLQWLHKIWNWWSKFQDGFTKISGINFLLDSVSRTQTHEEHLHSHNKLYFYLIKFAYIFPSGWNNRNDIICLLGVSGYITTNKWCGCWYYMVSFIQIRQCSQNVRQVQHNCAWSVIAWLWKYSVSCNSWRSMERKVGGDVPEQWAWVVPGSIMNTTSRMASNGSCQKISSSFEVSGKPPDQDRSEACTRMGIFLLVCVQWDCRWGLMCVCVWCVHWYRSLNHH